MKKYLRGALSSLLIASSILAATPVEKARQVFPSLAESIGYWREAVILLDKLIVAEGQLTSDSRVRCGRVTLYGGDPILCVRLEKSGKTIREAYFISRGRDTPLFHEDADQASVVMPSGFVLMDIKKEPIPASPPTTPNGRGSPGTWGETRCLKLRYSRSALGRGATRPLSCARNQWRDEGGGTNGTSRQRFQEEDEDLKKLNPTLSPTAQAGHDSSQTSGDS